jgi:hypothetical protein
MGLNPENAQPLGINDQDQILAYVTSADCETAGCPLEFGVISPFAVPAVPEPSTLLLLATVGLALLSGKLTL